MRTGSRRLAIGLAAVLALALVVVVYGLTVGYAGEFRARLAEQGPAAPVVDLHSVDQLRTAFNDDAGTPRLLVLFSPT